MGLIWDWSHSFLVENLYLCIIQDLSHVLNLAFFSNMDLFPSDFNELNMNNVGWDQSSDGRELNNQFGTGQVK